jgi:hypothetical protein
MQVGLKEGRKLIGYMYKDFKGRKVKPLHLFGVYCVRGIYGAGKTITMTYIAHYYKKRYKDDILIGTNFGLAFQDFEIRSQEDLLKVYDKTVLLFVDEVQNMFPAQQKPLDEDMRKLLTLNRKGRGKRIYWSTQDDALVHKTFRRLTIVYLDCKTQFNRLTRYRSYRAQVWERLILETDVKKMRKLKPFQTQFFVQHDYLRDAYNSYGLDNNEDFMSLANKAG